MRPRSTQRETHLPCFSPVPLNNSEQRCLPRGLQVGSKANEVLYTRTHFSPNNKYLRPQMPISSPSLYPHDGFPPSGTRLCYSKFCFSPLRPKNCSSWMRGTFPSWAFPSLLSAAAKSYYWPKVKKDLLGICCANRRLLDHYPCDVRDFLAFKSHAEPGDCSQPQKDG